MARVLLIVPHLPQRMGSPYLGQQYVASSLLADGHEVVCLDMAAMRFSGGDERAIAAAEDLQPDIVGMTLFTYNALAGYRLAAKLHEHTRYLIAGGPHPTVQPLEPLEHGFDVAVAGEGEVVVRQIAAALDKGDLLPDMPGVSQPARENPVYEAIEDLDGLAYPLLSYDSYDKTLYSADARVVPGGLMTSRGCPARCTFCANYVTGRKYRFRSAANIVGEMVALRQQHGVTHFPFWDDAFTALRPRLNELCDAIDAEPRLHGTTWTCITPGNMVKPRDLARMRQAGCVAINFGIESGDYNILKVIRKGQKPEQVIAAVAAAKAEGMMTIVNFMFGFPEEGVTELGHTLDLMEKLSASTDFFNNRGVLVPFPGTSIYDAHHEHFGFTGWWLDDQRIIDEPNIHVLDPSASQAYLEHDPTLDLDFFSYSAEVREMIARCVRFKARHNQTTIARMTSNSTAASIEPSPAGLQQHAAANVG